VSYVKLTVKRPPGVSAAEGAGLSVAVGTTLQALRSIGAKFDDSSKGKPTRRGHDGIGGVGHYAVQLTKLSGPHRVTTTCRRVTWSWRGA
jgi:chloroplastic oxoene reductase